MKTALITGVTGQDGSYLAELLLGKNYRVVGMTRRSSTENHSRIEHIREQIELISGDLLDESSLCRIVDYVQPDEVYNLAAQSFVPTSWQQPVLTGEFTALGVTRLLDACRFVGHSNVKFYQASSSEMFGKVETTRQNEHTPFHPRSPYGVAKVYGHMITQNYRESYGMHASSGILFNHESERRGLEFVTRKISSSVARIKCGLQTELRLGNLDAQRDWGHAEDYVRAMWTMLQQTHPGDYVIATGQTWRVRDFVQYAFLAAGLRSWQQYVVVDQKLVRPAEVDLLCGDITKAVAHLGWTPNVTFERLVQRMVENDIRLCERGEL